LGAARWCTAKYADGKRPELRSRAAPHSERAAWYVRIYTRDIFRD
jgi:hypothetical protein